MCHSSFFHLYYQFFWHFGGGESVPESKIPATDAALQVLNLKATSIHPSLAKHFLFCGTKIIRVRRPRDHDDNAVALAMVMRTGFATTKGSLIRSMLFPKPSGFKFYRDSFRYISVMGMVAILGFLASCVNFIRLGVSIDLCDEEPSTNSCTSFLGEPWL